MRDGSAQIQGSSSIHGVARDMFKVGWGFRGGHVWAKVIDGATGMPELPGVDFSRRVVRDRVSKVFIEDMWRTSSTPERLSRRSFRAPRDIEVEVEIDGNDVKEAASW